MGWLSPWKTGQDASGGASQVGDPEPAQTGTPSSAPPFANFPPDGIANAAGDPVTSQSEPSTESEALLPGSPETSASPGVLPQDRPPAVENSLGNQTAGAIIEHLEALSAEQVSLRELFHTRLRNDDVQNRALDRLLDELKDYKVNFIRQQMLPLLREVIECHDVAHRESCRLSADPDRSASSGSGSSKTESDGGKSLSVVAQMLRDLLARHDVESYQSELPDYDPKSQQCTRTVDTGDQALDKRVVESIVPGFRSPEMVIRRELVSVYRFRQAAPTEPPA